MPTNDHADTPEIDYSTLATLPTNPFAQKVTPPPDYVGMIGEHYAAGLAGAPALQNMRETLETEGGFEKPEVQDYPLDGVTVDVPAPQAQSQGGVSLPIAHEVLRQIVAKWNLGALYWQWEQANKVPTDGRTENAFPLVAGKVMQVGSRNAHRDTIILSNTGTVSFTVGFSEQQAQLSGFTVAVGGVLTLEVRAPVFIYVSGSTNGAVDILETTFSELRSPSSLVDLSKEQSTHGF